MDPLPLEQLLVEFFKRNNVKYKKQTPEDIGYAAQVDDAMGNDTEDEQEEYTRKREDADKDLGITLRNIQGLLQERLPKGSRSEPQQEMVREARYEHGMEVLAALCRAEQGLSEEQRTIFAERFTHPEDYANDPLELKYRITGSLGDYNIKYEVFKLKNPKQGLEEHIPMQMLNIGDTSGERSGYFVIISY